MCNKKQASLYRLAQHYLMHLPGNQTFPYKLTHGMALCCCKRWHVVNSNSPTIADVVLLPLVELCLPMVCVRLV